jgi:hypothetical protein
VRERGKDGRMGEKKNKKNKLEALNFQLKYLVEE